MTKIRFIAVLGFSVAAVSCSRQSASGPERGSPASPEPAPMQVSAASPPPEGSPGKRAVLVGINKYKYPDRVSPLAGAINDVEAMKDVLIGKFDFAPANVLTLTNEQATHAGIVSAIQQKLIAAANTGDIAVFYYSGHGSQMKDVSGDEPDGWDETLVPYDSRDPAGKVFDISDDELNGLMRQLSAKTKNVTVILDSCHSGTGLRNVPDATLRVKEISPDLRNPPTPPSYAIGQRGATSFAADTFKYSLISATTERQVAFEHLANGVERGVLSYFLVQALRRPSRMTYRDVMDTVGAQVNAAYPNQTPQLEGADSDQFVFGDASSLPLPYFAILRSGAGKASLAGGQVHGITTGSTFRVYAPGAKKFAPPEQPIATIRITSVDPFVSEADVLNKKTLPAGARAVEQEHRYENLRLRVYLNGPADDPDLQSLRQELSGDKHIEFVPDASRCHVQVRVRTGRFLTLTSDGYTLSTPVPVHTANATAKVADQLAKWAKWFNVYQINNNQGPEVQFSVLGVQGGSASPLRSIFGKGPSSLKDRDKVELVVENKSSKNLYVSILDLSTDGSIDMSYPEEQGAAELLQSGGRLTHRVEMFVPQGRSVVKDTFKLFASTKPIDLRPITQGRIKGAPDIAAGEDPLNDLIAESAGRMRGSRPVDTGQWTTMQKTVLVRH